MNSVDHLRLARRAADWAGWRRDESPEFNIWAALGAFALGMTGLLYYFALIKIKYTYGWLIGTMAIVEEAEGKMLLEIDNSDEEGLDKKATDGLLEPEMAVIKVKAVTAKFRSAKIHLKEQFGRWADFRGFGLFLVYEVLSIFLTGLFASFMPGHTVALVTIGVEVILSKLEMVWVHHVISASSNKRWTQRKESFAIRASQIMPAALLRSVAFQLVVGLPAALYCSYPPVHRLAHNPDAHDANVTPEHLERGAHLLAGSVVASLALALLVYIPAHVTFIRVAASLLPEQEQTHINFDRTFGGKIAPGEKIGLLDAWRTFAWEQRRRYLALWGKIFAITAAVTVLFVIAAASEVLFITGKPEIFSRHV